MDAILSGACAARSFSLATRKALALAVGFAVLAGPAASAGESPVGAPAALGEPVNRYAPDATVYGLFDDGEIHPWHVKGGLWLMAGQPGESNVIVHVGDEGVLVVGSGSMTHNLYEFRSYAEGQEAEYAREFAAWVRQTVEARDDARLQRTLAIAPHAQRAHPTDEHFLPLLVAAGAAAGETEVDTLEGGITYGMLSMDSFLFGARVTEAA